MKKTIVATFPFVVNAENSARQIRDSGMGTDDISIITKQGDESKNSYTMESKNTTQRNDNISDGLFTGGMLGGLAGLLIGTGSIMIPGLGIVAAAGPIAGLLED
jgi:predicted lipid-binding transport protein (Tim44 family)